MWFFLLCTLLSSSLGQPVTLIIAGDTNLNRNLLKTKKTLLYPWKGVEHIINSGDSFFLNHEGSVTKRTTNISDIALKETPLVAQSYNAANVSFVALANNHQSDFGNQTAADTKAYFEQHGIPHAGIGGTYEESAEPAILVVKGKRIAIFASMIGPVYDAQGRGQACWPAFQCTPPAETGLNKHPGAHYIPDAASAAPELIARAKALREREAIDLVIMFFHWGSNWDFMDGSSGDIWKQRQWLAHQLIDSGSVDMIWGTSAHHIQPVEIYKNKPIIYGQGNLMIPVPAGITPPPQYRTRLAFIYRATFDFPQEKKNDPSILSLEAVPIISDDWKIETLTNSSDLKWLQETYDRISGHFGTHINITEDGSWFIEEGEGGEEGEEGN